MFINKRFKFHNPAPVNIRQAHLSWHRPAEQLLPNLRRQTHTVERAVNRKNTFKIILIETAKPNAPAFNRPSLY